MKEFLRTVLAVLVAVLILVFFAGLAGYAKSSQKPTVKDGSYLVLSLAGAIVDYPIGGLSSQLFGGGPGSQALLLENLEKAAVDDRIKGVVLKIDNSTLGFAKLEELRNAVKQVQGKGKRVYAYSEFLSGRPYYIAAACDSIFMPRSGYVELKGWASGAMFVKGSLDKLGIKPNVHRIEKYKSAAEMVTREDMSPESREQTTWLMNDLYAEYITAVAADRSMTPSELESAFETALFLPEEAVEAGFVDGTLYWDQLEDRLKEPTDKKLKTVSGSQYGKVKRADVGLKGKKIAIVHAQGLIHSGTSGVDPLLGMTMGAKSVVKDLRAVMEDDDIVGVVFRVDSPGGSGLASDEIGRWASVVGTKKPIVVSMSDVAASGGYMISHRIRPIVACPNTITGSIGSITGKFNMHGLYDKLGMTYDFVVKGPNALIDSDYSDWTDEEAEIVAENHWKGFKDWERDIAKHRDMTFEQVDSVARGRVWTGRQALDRDLVDKLGGLDAALAAVKDKAQIPAAENVTLVHYPVKKGLVESLMSGELVTMVKDVLSYRVRSYLLQWALEGQSGWYVAPYVYTEQ
jgi:protease-4